MNTYFVEQINPKRLTKHIITTIAIILNPLIANSDWGFFAHEKIIENAIYVLPHEIYPFYKKHINYLIQQSTTPDSRRYTVEDEAPKHFINMEFYTDLDSNWTNWYELNELYPNDSLQIWGIGPWHIFKLEKQLSTAFYKKDQKKILKLSSEIAHYISDLMVPLHTTKNYNGQLSNQYGIHKLWETEIVEAHYNEYDLFTEKADYLENPKGLIWGEILDVYQKSKEVLEAEKKLSNEVGNKKYQWKSNSRYSKLSYSNRFLKVYYQNQKELVTSQLQKSIYYTASIWLTAWVNAGQPSLDTINSIPTPKVKKPSQFMGPKVFRKHWQ
ncbi:phospholipase C/P1 nuclease family protein [Sediminitomix flava]|uniref:S1/P1 nuclease n=1 Tax=Sediminitomix flava TaxID=379075 RepID=A0A315ZXT3_SEDFL|nr:S1/P1 Nuclease [Sediminitomix flava]PWJ42157.1 hypothetical protein BC781_103407 [Sediminitomix flava]